MAEFHGNTENILIRPILELDTNRRGLNNGVQPVPAHGAPPARPGCFPGTSCRRACRQRGQRPRPLMPTSAARRAYPFCVPDSASPVPVAGRRRAPRARPPRQQPVQRRPGPARAAAALPAAGAGLAPAAPSRPHGRPGRRRARRTGPHRRPQSAHAVAPHPQRRRRAAGRQAPAYVQMERVAFAEFGTPRCRTAPACWAGMRRCRPRPSTR